MDLIVSDLHFTDNPRDFYRFDRLYKIVEEIFNQYELERLFILGDLTENKDNHSSLLVNSVVNTLTAIQRKFSIEIHILKGNHDIAGSVPYFYFLNNIPHFYFYNELTRIGKIWMIPHRRNVFLTDEEIQKIDEKPSILFMHQTFAGFKMENGMTTSGMVFPEFKNDHVYVSGDLHVPQGMYVGSPWHVDFSDNFTPRVFLLDDRKLISYELPESADKIQVVIKSANDLLQLKDIQKNSVVKVKIEVSQERMGDVVSLQEQLKKFDNILIYSVEVVVQRSENKKQIQDVKTMSDLDIVKYYSKRKGLGPEMVNVAEALISE